MVSISIMGNLKANPDYSYYFFIYSSTFLIPNYYPFIKLPKLPYPKAPQAFNSVVSL